MTVKELTDLLIYLGAIAGAIAAIIAFLQFVIMRPLKKWMREQIVVPVSVVQAEVTTNGGHSIKDDTTATRSELDKLKKSLDAHLTDDVPADRAAVVKLQHQMDEHIMHHGGVL